MNTNQLVLRCLSARVIPFGLVRDKLGLRSPSATLHRFKAKAGINGLLPTSWVPSIYSVSALSRLRFALWRSLYFAFDACSFVPHSQASFAKLATTKSQTSPRPVPRSEERRVG